jgi:glycosyltransferase involved in cell wall biosynthesis|tara:strand:+ start:8877 stop:9863 length:987 start_codon:yes stop_codon:yes gene_type:complete
MRGSSLTLAAEAEVVVERHGKPDVVIVSGMTDLAAWLGFTRRFLGDTPVVLYLHENQLMYPLAPGQQADASLPLVNWLGMAAADEVWFNSTFQRDGLLKALPALLERAPDEVHTPWLDDVVSACQVVPVGVDLSDIPVRNAGAPCPEVLTVLWNQRWDHDKNPGAVMKALLKLAAEDIAFRVAIAGENTRVDPREMTEAREQLGDRVIQFGHLPRPEYVDLLGVSDVVVSAAHHEFFGIAVVEAVAAGAVPVLPTRQSYPELVPDGWHGAALYPEGGLTRRLREVLSDLPTWRNRVVGLDVAMRRFDWRQVVEDYDDRIDALSAGPCN